MPLKEQILATLTGADLPDFRLLASAEAIALYPKLLPELLHAAKERFAAILQIPEEDIDFANTVEAYLTQDEAVSMLFTFVNNLNSTDTTPALRELIRAFQPELVAYASEVSMHPEYYRRIKALSTSGHEFSSSQRRSMELIIREMEHAGVHLQGKKKTRLAEINTRLAALAEQFSSNVIDDRERFAHHFTDKKSLTAMPAEDLAMAREEAKRRKKKGYVFTLSPPSYLAIMLYCSDAAVRKRFWLASIASQPGQYDTAP